MFICRLDGRGITVRFWSSSDQSMHEKTAVSGLIEEIYTFLKQADARELRHLFVELDKQSRWR